MCSPSEQWRPAPLHVLPSGPPWNLPIASPAPLRVGRNCSVAHRRLSLLRSGEAGLTSHPTRDPDRKN
eukprot:scaffold137552_cov40-Tisochrysis_lutea.AAC.1